ncbi:hypothetical protein QCA50_015282 [Cerrena zonata]|uniref:Uncharacterized protein n=1 Tax=Cerrena zonata TaxID=2478898 RepID=A0AAW0FXU1_9APHY
MLVCHSWFSYVQHLLYSNIYVRARTCKFSQLKAFARNNPEFTQTIKSLYFHFHESDTSLSASLVSQKLPNLQSLSVLNLDLKKESALLYRAAALSDYCALSVPL